MTFLEIKNRKSIIASSFIQSSPKKLSLSESHLNYHFLNVISGRTLKTKEHLLFNFHPTLISPLLPLYVFAVLSVRDGRGNSSRAAAVPTRGRADTKRNTRKFHAICERDKKYIKQIKNCKIAKRSGVKQYKLLAYYNAIYFAGIG